MTSLITRRGARKLCPLRWSIMRREMPNEGGGRFDNEKSVRVE